MHTILKATLICFTFLFQGLVGAKNVARTLGLEDYHRTKEYFKECQIIKKLVLDQKYQSDCYTNYHHFNSDVESFYNQGEYREKVRIAAFNLWHPGSNSSPYKDFTLVAAMMNQYDIVAASELLGSVGKDLEHNERVKKFIKDAPRLMTSLQLRYRRSPSDELQEKIEELKDDMALAPSLYRLPGYLTLLDELREIDPSWSLILSPSGESADDGFVQELVGFYYRGRTVKPIINEHCQKFPKNGHGPSIACFPKLTKAWLGKSIRPVFSRRPFLGSFISGTFDFTLFTSHVVFRGSTDPESMANVLMPSFGVRDYQEMGRGATKANFARLAEMKIIMEIMQKIRMQSQEKDIIFLGDTNLESANDFWNDILNEFPGGKLYIDRPTTLSLPLVLSDGTITYGTANDYDHIIIDSEETTECLDEGEFKPLIENFIKGPFQGLIHNRYLYRFPDTLVVNPKNEEKRIKHIRRLNEQLRARLTIKRNKIVPDDTEIEESVREFDERVFLSQVQEDTYYKLYKEIISDHFPVSFNCSR